MSSLVIRRTGSKEYGRFIKALIVGPPGSGKTIFGSTWPNPFYASCEGGMMSIAKLHLPYTDITAIEQLHALKVVLSAGPEEIKKTFGFQVETIIIDTIDEVYRMIMKERLESQHSTDGIPVGKDWQHTLDVITSMVRGFRNLPMNVIFTCHVKEVSEGDGGRTYYKPQIAGQFADQIPGAVDLAVMIKSKLTTKQEDKKVTYGTERYLQTYVDNQYDWIKDRSGTLPKEFPVNFRDDYERLYETIYGGIDLEEYAEREIEVEIPQLVPPRAPEAPATRRRQVARPAATTARPGRPPLPQQPSTVAKEEEPQLPGVGVEDYEIEQPPTEPTEPEENQTDGKLHQIKICNPDGFMPGTDIVLKPLGHDTDIYCQTCGNELGLIEGPPRLTAEEQSKYSIIRHRLVLCRDCFNEENR